LISGLAEEVVVGPDVAVNDDVAVLPLNKAGKMDLFYYNTFRIGSMKSFY
jgi:hypothetical protein